MNVTEEELRALVREAVARQLGRPRVVEDRAAGRLHPSHALLRLVTGAGAGDACLIEPGVRCNHCGYCQSYGH
jgi:hypothetical protein